MMEKLKKTVGKQISTKTIENVPENKKQYQPMKRKIQV